MFFFNIKISKELKRLRKESGMSQEVVAKRAGLARSHYVSIENGKHDAEDATLMKMLLALNIPMSQAKDIIAQWRIESMLKNASDPEKVIQNITQGKNSNVINTHEFNGDIHN